MQYRYWTEYERSIIQRFYPQGGATACQQHIDRPAQQIRDQAFALSIKLENIQEVIIDVRTRKLTGRPCSQAVKDAARRRAYENIDRYKEQLLRGRMTCQTQTMSKAEHKAETFLIELGVSYRKQVPFPPYICDFVIVDTLALEIDGDYWHGHRRFYPLTAQQLRRRYIDKLKTAVLIERGFAVVRIWESELTRSRLEDELHNHLITKASHSVS